MALYGLKWHFMVLYGIISSFLALIDPNSFGLVWVGRGTCNTAKFIIFASFCKLIYIIYGSIYRPVMENRYPIILRQRTNDLRNLYLSARAEQVAKKKAKAAFLRAMTKDEQFYDVIDPNIV